MKTFDRLLAVIETIKLSLSTTEKIIPDSELKPRLLRSHDNSLRFCYELKHRMLNDPSFDANAPEVVQAIDSLERVVEKGAEILLRIVAASELQPDRDKE